MQHSTAQHSTDFKYLHLFIKYLKIIFISFVCILFSHNSFALPMVAASEKSSYAIQANGQMWSWGAQPDLPNKTTPDIVGSGFSFISLSEPWNNIYEAHQLALKLDSSLWGRSDTNYNNQLGISYYPRYIFNEIGADFKIAHAASGDGYIYSIGLKNNSDLYLW